MFNFWVVVLAHSFPLPVCSPVYSLPIPHLLPLSLFSSHLTQFPPAYLKHLARCKTQPSLFHPSHWTDYLSNLMPKQVRIQQTPSPPIHIHFLTSPSPSPFSLISAFSFFILYDTPFPAILIFFLLDKICLAQNKHFPNILGEAEV